LSLSPSVDVFSESASINIFTFLLIIIVSLLIWLTEISSREINITKKIVAVHIKINVPRFNRPIKFNNSIMFLRGKTVFVFTDKNVTTALLGYGIIILKHI
jgi:hypothetical protein